MVSGNDVAAPVLGYTESGNFDPNNIPPGLKHMLAYYSEQIKQAVADGAAPYAETESMRMDSGNERTAIEPLCPTNGTRMLPIGISVPHQAADIAILAAWPRQWRRLFMFPIS